MFIKGINYLKGRVICWKNLYIIDLSELSQLLQFAHALKEISETIFWKTFRNFAVLHIAQKSRKGDYFSKVIMSLFSSLPQ